MTRISLLTKLPLLLLLSLVLSSCNSDDDDNFTKETKATLTITMDEATCRPSTTVVAIDEVTCDATGYAFNGITLSPGRSFDLSLVAETYDIRFTGYDERGMRTLQWTFEVVLDPDEKSTEVLSCVSSSAVRRVTPEGAINHPVGRTDRSR